MRLLHALSWVLFGPLIVAGQFATLTSAATAVYLPELALPAQTIQEFLSDPAALLGQFPDGGEQMVAQVRDLAASDASTLSALVGLLATANANQTNAIGTGLGQTAVLAVKADPSYANAIQQAIARTSTNRANKVGPGSLQPKIGSAVLTKDQVDGQTERGTQPIAAGTLVYLDEMVRTGVTGRAELLLADRTNLTVAPTTEIRLDKFVYDPGGASGNVVVIATLGAFRFITGVQPHENYEIKTPVATLGVRGTEFIALVQQNGAEIQLNSGAVIVTTISGKVVPMNIPQTVLTVDSQGNTQGPTPVSQPLVNFADLGPPVTNTALSDALAAFAAVTGDTTIGAAGGGGGGGETGTGGGGGGIGEGTLGGGVPLNPNNATVTESDNFPPPPITTTSTPFESVSPSR
jgi:hypothetical protein